MNGLLQTLADATTYNSTIALPHTLSCRGVSLAVMPYAEKGCTIARLPSSIHVKIKHSLAHLQDLIPTLAGRRYISNNTSQSRD